MVVNNIAPTELDTFLPHDGSNEKDEALTAKYKVSITPREAESAITNGKRFDPFTERKLENPTTDGQTLTHLLKASLGTGILAMPFAFKDAGLIAGIFLTIFVAFICTYGAYILVKCAHALYHKTKKTKMSYADVAETAFAEGPQQFRIFSKPSRYIIDFGLFLTYFGTCSAYTVIIAKNYGKIFRYYQIHYEMEGNANLTSIVKNLNSTDTDLLYDVSDTQIRWIILAVGIPLVLLTLIPNLKYLAPVSMIANGFMGVSLFIIFGYFFKFIIEGKAQMSEVAYVNTNFKDISMFFAISIFAMEAIGVIMPLENNMQTPQNFIGTFGVLNKGMSGVTVIYIILGFLGYLVFPNMKTEIITTELPRDEIAAQIVLFLVGSAVLCTFSLQFFVCLDILWAFIKDRFTNRPKLANYITRIIMVVLCVALAIAVPTIGPFIGFIGAFCFSILGLTVPAIIETVTFWDDGFGRYNWIAIKNILIVIFSFFALGAGSFASSTDIYNLLTGDKEVVEFQNGTIHVFNRAHEFLREMN